MANEYLGELYVIPVIHKFARGIFGYVEIRSLGGKYARESEIAKRERISIFVFIDDTYWRNPNILSRFMLMVKLVRKPNAIGFTAFKVISPVRRDSGDKRIVKTINAMRKGRDIGFIIIN
jgi:hypothetical protein